MIEKWPHPFGTEYCLVFGDKILGSVVPMDKPALNQRQRWKALVGHRIVGVFTGADGRLCAMRAVRHFAKHLWCGVGVVSDENIFQLKEFDGMGNLEKKKLEKSAWSKSRYQARRLAGLCGLGCGSVPESGACCRACREKVKSRAETLRGNFNTCSGCHAYLDTSNRRCSKCLEKKRLYNKKNRSSQFGKWASSIRVATLKVAKGLNSRGCSYLNSKLFEWSHFDFKSKFPLHDFENKELQIDHIIPLGVACCSDGAVDQSIAHMVGGLGNIQIISGKKNSFKGLNNDAKCKKRSTELRLTGYSGDHLWSALVAEFSHEPMDV